MLLYDFAVSSHRIGGRAIARHRHVHDVPVGEVADSVGGLLSGSSTVQAAFPADTGAETTNILARTAMVSPMPSIREILLCFIFDL